MERLQKRIAESGICSRRKAEELIVAGKVKVNGKVVSELGYKVSGNDEIVVDGKNINKEEKVVYLLNKPKNVISAASDDRGRLTVIDYIDSPYRLYPLGRLDYDSSGLILISNDGKLMQKMIHPKYHIQKTYEVTINGLITDKQIKQLEKGIKIDDYITGEANIKLIRQNTNKNTSLLEVTIYEGKNRQIRKMFKVVGYDVIKLHRIKEANLSLGNLRSGEYRKLKNYEVKKLYEYLDRDNF